MVELPAFFGTTCLSCSSLPYCLARSAERLQRLAVHQSQRIGKVHVQDALMSTYCPCVEIISTRTISLPPQDQT